MADTQQPPRGLFRAFWNPKLLGRREKAVFYSLTWVLVLSSFLMAKYDVALPFPWNFVLLGVQVACLVGVFAWLRWRRDRFLRHHPPPAPLSSPLSSPPPTTPTRPPPGPARTAPTLPPPKPDPAADAADS